MSLLNLTTQHEPTICGINTQKPTLEVKIYFTEYKHEYRTRP